MRKGYAFMPGLVLALCAAACQAATLADKGPLPAAIEQCVVDAACSVATDSVFELGGIAAFAWTSVAGPGFLLAYPLLPPSHASVATPLTGTLWLGVQASYVTLADHRGVTLFTDRVKPDEKRLLPRYAGSDYYPAILNFDLSVAALLAGHAEHRVALGGADGYSSGDLVAFEPLLPCVADGCSAAQQINLI